MSKKPASQTLNEAQKSSAAGAHPRRVEKQSASKKAQREYRIRQTLTASILKELYGSFEDSDPNLWNQGSYLGLVGSVYERLVTGKGVPIRELLSLSKVLAECRRFDGGSHSKLSGQQTDSLSGKTQQEPNDFKESVRDLYGTNLPSAEQDLKRAKEDS